MSSSFDLEPPPQNELERLLLKAGDEPALQGRMYRLLWESQLFVFVPDHPEIQGWFPLRNGDEFVFCMCPHEEGTFMAVFTSEAAAEWAADAASGTRAGDRGACRAKRFSGSPETAKTWVRVNHGMIGEAVAGTGSRRRGWCTGAGPSCAAADRATGRRWSAPKPGSCPSRCWRRSACFARSATGRSGSSDSSTCRTRRCRSNSTICTCWSGCARRTPRSTTTSWR